MTQKKWKADQVVSSPLPQREVWRLFAASAPTLRRLRTELWHTHFVKDFVTRFFVDFRISEALVHQEGFFRHRRRTLCCRKIMELFRKSGKTSLVQIVWLGSASLPSRRAKCWKIFKKKKFWSRTLGVSTPPVAWPLATVSVSSLIFRQFKTGFFGVSRSGSSLWDTKKCYGQRRHVSARICRNSQTLPKHILYQSIRRAKGRKRKTHSSKVYLWGVVFTMCLVFLWRIFNSKIVK